MALGEDEHMTCLRSWHFVQDLPDYFSKVVLPFPASPFLRHTVDTVLVPCYASLGVRPSLGQLRI